MEELNKQHMESLVNGTCIDCQAQMPNYPPEEKGWQPAEGWTWFSQGSGSKEEIVAWQCPECDKKEED